MGREQYKLVHPARLSLILLKFLHFDMKNIAYRFRYMREYLIQGRDTDIRLDKQGGKECNP